MKHLTKHQIPYVNISIDHDEEIAPLPSIRVHQRIKSAVSDVSTLALLFALWILSESVLAGITSEHATEVPSEEPAYSSLWVRSLEETSTHEGESMSATTLATDISMTVSGPILRAKVRQTFRNPSQFWSEGIYTFPLPEQAAVDRLRMVIGDRVVEGQIHEKKSARRIYQKARDAGKRTSLLSHNRTNVFTTAVANIGPNEEITVEFEYQQILDFKRNRYTLRFPMVNTPKYTPARVRLDSAFVEPVDVIRKMNEPPGNPVTISVDLKAGFPIETLSSTSHAIKTEQLSDEHYTVKLDGLAQSSNRDFILSWQLEPSDEPLVRVLREDLEGESYGLLMVMPPQPEPGMTTGTPRELVLVLDVSGSMQGESIEQARSAVLKAISQLNPEDYFNVIYFNTQAKKQFSQNRPATPDNLSDARRSVLNQKAEGGTDMRPALRMALNGSDNFEHLRQVIFITDGAVSNEAELFSEIQNNLGNSRLFTVGIGSAPNSYFMRKAARAGRGTFTYVSRPNEVDQKISHLLQQLEAPALTNLNLDLNSYSTVVLPQLLPDLYLGEPVYVAFKMNTFPDFAELSGELGGVSSRLRIPLQSPDRHEGVAVEWARRKITALMRQHREQTGENRKENQQAIRNEVIDLAVSHHQVSQFTSLVAVDITPVRGGGLLNTTRIPANRPKGWVDQSNPKSKGIRLAQTATDTGYKLLIGSDLLFGSFLLWLARRRLQGKKIQRRKSWPRACSRY